MVSPIWVIRVSIVRISSASLCIPYEFHRVRIRLAIFSHMLLHRIHLSLRCCCPSAILLKCVFIILCIEPSCADKVAIWSTSNTPAVFCTIVLDASPFHFGLPYDILFNSANNSLYVFSKAYPPAVELRMTFVFDSRPSRSVN